MTDETLRLVEELWARYENEPDLADVYVEGVFDKDLLTHALRRGGRRDVTVYPIETVAVDHRTVAEYGMTDGNKQRVVALARKLSGLGPSVCARFVVDRDSDGRFPPVPAVPRLKYTEYNDLESYFVTQEDVRELLITTAMAKIPDFAAYWESFVKTLRAAFAMRLVDRECGYRLQWLSLDRSLSRNGDRVVFDETDFVKKLLLKNSKGVEQEKFRAALLKWRNELDDDPRHECRGHDLCEVLAWSVKKWSGVTAFGSRESIERLLVAMAPHKSDFLRLAVD